MMMVWVGGKGREDKKMMKEENQCICVEHEKLGLSVVIFGRNHFKKPIHSFFFLVEILI